MSDDKVVSIFGGSVAIEDTPKQVYPGLVEHLERLLEEAKRGELVGIGLVALDYNNHASYSLVGSVGGYSMMGALDMVKSHLIDMNRGYMDDE